MPPLAIAVGMIGSSIIGAVTNRPSSTDKALAAQNLANSQQAAAQSKQLFSSGTGDISTARSLLADPTKYWQTLLSGNMNAITSYLSPEINTIMGQYDSAKKSISEFSPRGGGRSAAMANAGFTSAGQIGNLVAKARPTAANQLTSIADIYKTLGLTETGQSTGNLQASTQAASSQQQIDATTSAQNSSTLGSLGSSAGSLLYLYLMGNKSGGQSPVGAGGGFDMQI